MIVGAVLMISCQVSTAKNTIVGAPMRASSRQPAKNHAWGRAGCRRGREPVEGPNTGEMSEAWSSTRWCGGFREVLADSPCTSGPTCQMWCT